MRAFARQWFNRRPLLLTRAPPAAVAPVRPRLLWKTIILFCANALTGLDANTVRNYENAARCKNVIEASWRRLSTWG